MEEGRSSALFERATALLPGGVNSPVRAMRQIGRNPLFIRRGEGPYLEDVDGNRFIDWVCSYGPLILGHSHPAVVEAVRQAAAEGLTFGAPTPLEVELAAAVVARVPGAEQVRMTCSGTEAVMTALRLARAATGRERVVKFAGCYHGHADQLLLQGGSGLAGGGLAAAPGVPEAVAAQTVVVPWNDRAALARALEGRPAALILELLPANMGVVEPALGFLEEAAAFARANGALLIADEVITGFRLAPGGAQERYGVEADLTVLGKVVGGGLPVGAVAGPRRLLSLLAPEGEVYQAGTLSGNPLAVAAGLATLAKLDSKAYSRLAELTTELACGLREATAAYPLSVVAAPGLLTLFFREEPPRNLAEVQGCDLAAFGRFCRDLLAEGVYLPPSQFEAWFPSLAHGPQEVERTVGAVAKVVARLFKRRPTSCR